jgi:hypothetical protein
MEKVVEPICIFSLRKGQVAFQYKARSVPRRARTSPSLLSAATISFMALSLRPTVKRSFRNIDIEAILAAAFATPSRVSAVHRDNALCSIKEGVAVRLAAHSMPSASRSVLSWREVKPANARRASTMNGSCKSRSRIVTAVNLSVGLFLYVDGMPRNLQRIPRSSVPLPANLPDAERKPSALIATAIQPFAPRQATAEMVAVISISGVLMTLQSPHGGFNFILIVEHGVADFLA